MFDHPGGEAASLIEDRAGILRRAVRTPRRTTGLALNGCSACGARDAPASVIVRSAALPRPIAEALLLAPSLTARELAAFELLGFGYDNRSIARRLSISERTAKRHVTAILAKLRLESRLQAGLTAMIINLATVAESACCAARPEGRTSHDKMV